MSTISLITILFFLSLEPTYTEIIQDKDIRFYRQKGNFYSVTNLSSGYKTIGIKTRWGDCYLRIFKINTKNLRLAVDGFGEVKKQTALNRFNQDDYRYYEEILNNPQDFDSLAHTFLCWRTSYQMSKYGVSNYSYIPNSFYNKKKKMIINKLKLYLKYHPDFITQIAYLENLSDIVRGGFMGNSVLNDLAFLSGDRD